jgi:hypothetical protein
MQNEFFPRFSGFTVRVEQRKGVGHASRQTYYDRIDSVFALNSRIL